METPPSREVRMADGVTEGFAEQVALSIYSGSTTELIHGITAIELTIESKRADAARTIAQLVTTKLTADGFLVAKKIDVILEEFLEDDLLAS